MIPKRVPVPLRSEQELLEETKSEETDAEDMGTFDPSLIRNMRKMRNYKIGLYTHGQQNQKRSRKEEMPCTFEQEMVLD